MFPHTPCTHWEHTHTHTCTLIKWGPSINIDTTNCSFVPRLSLHVLLLLRLEQSHIRSEDVSINRDTCTCTMHAHNTTICIPGCGPYHMLCWIHLYSAYYVWLNILNLFSSKKQLKLVKTSQAMQQWAHTCNCTQECMSPPPFGDVITVLAVAGSPAWGVGQPVPWLRHSLASQPEFTAGSRD